MAAIGTFDSFNPFIVKGNPAAGVGADLRHAADAVGRRAVQRVRAARRDDRDAGGPLLGRVHPAPGGALARRQADHRRRRDLDLRHAARPRASRSTAPTTRSVDQGREDRRAHACKFTFEPGENRELPLILGQLPVLPKHYWETRDFEKTTLEPPLGSGPYKIEQLRAGPLRSSTSACRTTGATTCRSTSAATTSTSSRYDYYRDDDGRARGVQGRRVRPPPRELGQGLGHRLRLPGGARRAASCKEEIPNERPAGMQGFVVQHAPAAVPGPAGARGARPTPSTSSGRTRTSSTASTRARAATSPTPSWPRRGLPSAASWRSSSRSAASSRTRCSPPSTTRRRPTARATSATTCARRCELLERGRLEIDAKTRKLVNADSGAAVRLRDPARRPAVRAHRACPSCKNLEAARHRRARVRTVDTAQYQQPARRLRLRHDRRRLGRSRCRRATSSATSGARRAPTRRAASNFIGIKDPVVDALVEALIAAPDRASLVARTPRARPRAAVGPLRDPALAHPRTTASPTGTSSAVRRSPRRTACRLDTWWIDPAKARARSARDAGVASAS